MAFNKRFLDPTNSGSKGVKTLAAYQSETDNKATILGAGYFNSVSDELQRVALILIIATNATFLAKVTVANKVVTLSAPDTFA